MHICDILTEDDNKSLNPVHCWGAVFALAGLGLEIYCTVTGKPFDLQAYGVGSAMMLTGLGVGKKLGAAGKDGA